MDLDGLLSGSKGGKKKSEKEKKSKNPRVQMKPKRTFFGKKSVSITQESPEVPQRKDRKAMDPSKRRSALMMLKQTPDLSSEDISDMGVLHSNPRKFLSANETLIENMHKFNQSEFEMKNLEEYIINFIVRLLLALFIWICYYFVWFRLFQFANETRDPLLRRSKNPNRFLNKDTPKLNSTTKKLDKQIEVDKKKLPPRDGFNMQVMIAGL